MKSINKIDNNIFSKTITIPSFSKKNIWITDINNFNLDMELIININENSEVILNLSTFSNSTNKKYKIIVNHLHNSSKSECNVFGVSKNNGSIYFDLTASINDKSLKNLCKQSISGIILSNDSSIIGCPNLIINTNSIKAKHSLAIGKISDDKIFYLKTKGLSKEESIFILIMSYFNSCIENINNKELQESIRKKIKKRI